MIKSLNSFSLQVGRQLALVRGVQSMVGCFTSPAEERIAFAIKDCIKMGFCSPGDTIVSVYYCACCD